MAFFEQAALLATAWANNEDLRALGAKHSLCVIKSRQLSRRHLHACSVWFFSRVFTKHFLLSNHAWAKVMSPGMALQLASQCPNLECVLVKGCWSKLCTNFFPCVYRGDKTFAAPCLLCVRIYFQYIESMHAKKDVSKVRSTRCSPESSRSWCTSFHALPRYIHALIEFVGLDSWWLALRGVFATVHILYLIYG